MYKYGYDFKKWVWVWVWVSLHTPRTRLTPIPNGYTTISKIILVINRGSLSNNNRQA